MAAPKAPDSLGRSGRALWRAVTGRYVLEPHELELLRRACWACDRVAGLEARAAAAGSGGFSPVLLREWRLLAIVEARLLTALRLPAESGPGAEPGEVWPQARAIRGAYAAGAG